MLALRGVSLSYQPHENILYSPLALQLLLQAPTALHQEDPKEFSIKAEACTTWAGENVMEKGVLPLSLL